MAVSASVAGTDVSPLHFIGGKRVGADGTFVDISPIDESPLAEVARGGAVEVDAAVRAASEPPSRPGPSSARKAARTISSGSPM